MIHEFAGQIRILTVQADDNHPFGTALLTPAAIDQSFDEKLDGPGQKGQEREKKGGEEISFDEIKEDIIQSQTLLAQQQVILDYLEKLKAKKNIEINEQLLQ